MAFPGSSQQTRPPAGPAPAVGTGDPGAPVEPDAEWPVQATDAIVRMVDAFRDRTTGPALDLARYLIYGVVVLALSLPVAIVGLIGLMRGAEGLLLLLGSKTGWAWLHDPIWIVYLTFGTLFTLAGLWSWRKAKQPAAA